MADETTDADVERAAAVAGLVALAECFAAAARGDYDAAWHYAAESAREARRARIASLYSRL